MRAAVLSGALLSLSACGGPAPAPAPEEFGQDDADAPMEPDPDSRAMRFEAMSRTAEAFTGAIELSVEPRADASAAPRMKLAGSNGLTFVTELIPGGAEQATAIDWQGLFGQEVAAAANAAPGAPSVEIHSVIEENVPTAAANGGFCGAEPTSFIALASGLETPAGEPFMAIAAFRGQAWPAEDAALCGVFTYAPPQ